MYRFFFIVIISFIWRRFEIGPGNNADASIVTDQHAIDGPNATNVEVDLLTTINITQKQIGKICLCYNNYFMYDMINFTKTLSTNILPMIECSIAY